MAHPTKLSSFLATIRLSLNGEHQDFTQGSIPRAVVLLAIPMILELSLESVFAVVDIFFVSKLGENAIATVGLTESAITILYSISIGLSTAATAIVARRTGEKNPEAAAHASAQALLLSVFLSVLLSISGIVYAADILRWMGASPQVIDEGTSFAQIMLGSSICIMLLFLINGIFRGAGNAAIAMKSLWLACAINIVLCPLMINWYGLKGAAIATVIGRGIGVLYQCYHIIGGKSGITIQRRYFNPDLEQIKSIYAIAWPGTLQFIIASGSWIVLTRMVADLDGTTASAGYQIALRNFMFFILPAWGLSNAAATLVGQNLGANQIERAHESVMLATKYIAYFTAAVMILFVLGAGPIIQLFTSDAGVASFATLSLRIFGSGYILYGVAMVLTSALNGAGDTKSPTYINLVSFWIFQIPFAWFLAFYLNLKSTGIFIAVPCSQLVVVAMTWYFYKKGKWKHISI
ncbi:MAG: MATE family efflux transporter [Cytophagaceae bacterium]|jgi:putative MATE family efflux protein|nr:MATE family efflux transporter [Cytophagaceae bacterium]